MVDGVIPQHHVFALEFLEQIDLNSFQSIIDLGCGDGDETEWFIARGKESVGVDLIVPDGSFVKANFHALPFGDREFDAAWSHHALEHTPNPLDALMEWGRVVKDGGLLFLTVPQIDNIISGGHINSFMPGDILYLLAIAGWDMSDGYFIKVRSHLRFIAKKVAVPCRENPTMSLSAVADRMPPMVAKEIKERRRFRSDFAKLRWIGEGYWTVMYQ